MIFLSHKRWKKSFTALKQPQVLAKKLIGLSFYLVFAKACLTNKDEKIKYDKMDRLTQSLHYLNINPVALLVFFHSTSGGMNVPVTVTPRQARQKQDKNCACKGITLPETNSLHLKISHPKRKVIFQPSIFGSALLVSVRVVLLLHFYIDFHVPFKIQEEHCENALKALPIEKLK